MAKKKIKKGKNTNNPFKGFSGEELRFFKQQGMDVQNFRMPPMPRPAMFDDRTKFRRSREKQRTRREIRDY